MNEREANSVVPIPLQLVSQPPPCPHPYQPTAMGNLPQGTRGHGLYCGASDFSDEALEEHSSQVAR